MVHGKRDWVSKTDEYATSVEFCELFRREMKSLYLLCLLLTAKHENAEECFVSSFDECLEGNSVFKEWAHSWAKRMIVKNAIQMIAPRLCTDKDAVADPSDVCCGVQGTQAAHRAMVEILALHDFERFVFVLSVLERYSDRDCAFLLGCTQHEVFEARAKAFWQIGDHNAANPPKMEDRKALK